jgi:hypothetical protein
MSAPDPESALAPLPEVPSTPRLAWLLFMQPLKLHRMLAAWGLEGDPSLWRLRDRWRAGDRQLRRLVLRLLALNVLWVPLGAVVVGLLSFPWVQRWALFALCV